MGECLCQAFRQQLQHCQFKWGVGGGEMFLATLILSEAEDCQRKTHQCLGKWFLLADAKPWASPDHEQVQNNGQATPAGQSGPEMNATPHKPRHK